jgi:hypothetical protein
MTDFENNTMGSGDDYEGFRGRNIQMRFLW